MSALYLFTPLQCFTSVLIVGVAFAFSSLCVTTATVSAYFQMLKAAILDIRRQYISPHVGQEDGQVHTAANTNLQSKLNECIRHLQEIMT
jgi:hypothetical protein